MVHLTHEFIDLILGWEDVRSLLLLLLRLSNFGRFTSLCFLGLSCESLLILEFLTLFTFLLLIFNLLRRFVSLLFEEKVDDGRPHCRVTEDASSARFSCTREWRIFFILSIDQVRHALATSVFGTVNHASTLQYADPKVTWVTLYTPFLLWVILNDEVACKALDTEINDFFGAFVLCSDLIAQQKLLVGIWVLTHRHDSQELLHNSNTHLEISKFVLENLEHVSCNSVEINLALGNHLTGPFDILSNLR